MSTRPIPPAEPTPPLAELARAVDSALSAVLATDFPVDPILGSEVSELVSKAASLQKRHGHLLEQGIVAALRASGRYEVLTSVNVPITLAADSLVASTPPETLERIALRYDAPAARTVNLDFVVIDEARGWAGAFDAKRGNGALTQRLMRPLVRDLECAGVLLRSYLRDRHYTSVDRVTVGLIDVYGSSGAPSHLAINLADLDDFFGVPVVSVIEAMNARLERAFRRAVPGLLAAVQGAVADGVPEGGLTGPAVAPARPLPARRPRTPAREAGPGGLPH